MHSRKTWVSGLVLLMVVGCVVVSAAEMRGPQARAVRTATPIAVDGRLDEPAWAQAAWATGFHLAGTGSGGGRAAVQTRFKTVWTDDALYVAVECDEPRIAELRAKTPWRDGAVWEDDCVEIFFDPANDGRYYQQIMVNARGTIFDMRAADYGLVKSRLWDGVFRAAGSVDREQGRWRVEVEVPFGALPLPENAGSTWKWNVTRERHAGVPKGVELTSWAPLAGSFHQPLKFGRLTGLPTDYDKFRIRPDEPRISVRRRGNGVSAVEVRWPVTNSTGGQRRLRAALQLVPPENAPQTPAENSLDLADGASGTFAFAPIETRKRTSDLHLVLRISQDADGRLLRAVRRKLRGDFRPLRVTLLRPVYRNSFFPDETADRIEFRIEPSPDVAAQAAIFAWRLEGPSGVLASGKQTGEGLEKAPDFVCLLQMPPLAAGDYELVVDARDANGKTVASERVPVHRLPPPPGGSTVRIDEQHRLLVDGKPFFGIGWYGGVPVEDPRQDVVALQNVTTPTVLIGLDAKSVRNAFERHGIRSIVSVENGRLFHTFRLWQKKNAHLKHIVGEPHKLERPSDDMVALVRRLVEAVRNEPGLLGYYIADEPEIHDVRSEYLENYYRLLRKLDPYHPVFVTNDTMDGLISHGVKCADVLDPDPYSPDWQYVPNFLKRIRAIARPGQAWWVTPWHSTARTHFTRPFDAEGGPYPYRVFRNQYFSSVAYGACGFTAYTSAFFIPEIEYRYGLPPVWRELRFLERALAAPVVGPLPEATRAADRLAVRGCALDGRVALIAVNHSGDRAETEVIWPPLGNRRLVRMSEGGTVRAENGRLRLRFTAGQVHILTDLPGAESFPAAADIEKDLARRLAASARPGNLLHWTRGVRAAASKGYFAPWFTQYYWYAINGVRDDRGWRLTHTAGKPAWLDLTLPKPATVGRLEIYTPNVRDYEIVFTGPDGAQTAFRINDNRETVVRHGFDPPVRFLKLRMTVFAKRPDSKDAPAVSEIEAYRDRADAPLVRELRNQTPPAPSGAALFPIEDGPGLLWTETFQPFRTAPKFKWDGHDDAWIVDPAQLEALPQDNGGVALRCRSARGYAGMTHIFACDPTHRFLQMRLSRIEGKGYRFSSVQFTDGSGKLPCRGLFNTSRTGLWTADLHAVHPSFADGSRRRGFLRITVAGSRKQPDGEIAPGPRFEYDWVRLADRPAQGLAVTLADGRPLPKVLKAGDKVHIELHLKDPAADASVQPLGGSNYGPVSLGGTGRIPLRRANRAGTVWMADLTVGKDAGAFQCKGYPLVFRADVAGVNGPDLWFSAYTSVLRPPPDR
ncbi:MAG: hypothetical protein GXP31_04730 [Kiritimatiellaeota bacterium]|nr:hypothetical protein [Kiritimatiellota bacterium]